MPEFSRILTVIVCIGVLFTGLVAVALQREETQTDEFPEISEAITGMLNVGFTITAFSVIFVCTAGVLFGALLWFAGKA